MNYSLDASGILYRLMSKCAYCGVKLTPEDTGRALLVCNADIWRLRERS